MYRARRCDILPVSFVVFAVCILMALGAAVHDDTREQSEAQASKMKPAVEKTVQRNCTSAVRKIQSRDIEIHPLYPPGYDHDDSGYTGSHKNMNCSLASKDPEVSMTLPEQYLSWRAKVIIACTIVVAIEVIIVIFIILKWREIRWTLRKMKCPCGERTEHQAMEITDEDEETFEVEESEPVISLALEDQRVRSSWRRVDQSVQTYAVPGPSGLQHVEADVIVSNSPV